MPTLSDFAKTSWMHNLSSRGARSPRLHAWRLFVLVIGLGGPLTLICPTATSQTPAYRVDILVQDFEGASYGDWTVTGEAFGTAPAKGALPGQMEVTGYLDQGLANSFRSGDDSTGTLASPPFTIDRHHLNFLIGGGGFAGETCINLRVDGNVVRTAVGPNTEPGGSERLRWKTWDVRDLAGKQAVIEIVDQRKGGWGHINVDQIVQSDQPRQAAPASREIVVERRYLHLPVKTGVEKQRLKLTSGEQTLREFEIELAPDRPDFWVFVDLKPFQGRTIKVEANELEPESKGLAAIAQGDDLPERDTLYREANRPQFHFTSRRGWLNDPNGLVWHKGVYHLYYQHNPYGWPWGNMHWGHAESPDLVHWTEQPIALYPQRYGDWCFSGSALVDSDNTSGFSPTSEPPLVAAYTSTGRGECIVFSNDQGRTWQEFEDNPVVKHEGRDPRLLWYAPGRHWVMAVYDEGKDRQSIAFHTSPDLKTWTYQSKIDGFFECPDLFELPVEGTPGQSRWILLAADAKYLLGDFDGKAFHPTDGKEKLQLWHGNYYASQTFSNTPDGRRIQIGWANGTVFPGMPFNQQMSLPTRLTLRQTADGPRLHAWPVDELASLREKTQTWSDLKLAPGDDPLQGMTGDLVEIEAEFSPENAKAVSFQVGGSTVTYDAASQTIACGKVRVPLPLRDGRAKLRIFVDRGSVEIFGDDGRLAISVAAIADPARRSISLASEGGTATIQTLAVHELKSAWNFK